jgi:hypothetical protein
MYQGVVKGQIHHRERQFRVDFTIGRDVRVEQVPQLLREISSWYAKRFPSIRLVAR